MAVLYIGGPSSHIGEDQLGNDPNIPSGGLVIGSPTSFIGQGFVGSGEQTSITPGTGTLSTSGQSAVVSRGTVITPGTGALSFAGVAPTPVQGTVITPTTGALSLTGVAPSAVQSTVITPSVGALTLAGVAPSIFLETFRTPTVGVLTLAGIAPSAVQSTVITPSTGALNLVGVAPSPVQGTVIKPNVGALTLTGVAPTTDNTMLIGVRSSSSGMTTYQQGVHQITLPPTIQQGDLLLMWVGNHSANTLVPNNEQGPWTSVGSVTNGGTGQAWSKIADGTEGGQTLTVANPSGMEWAAYIVYAIRVWDGYSIAFQTSQGNTGDPNPPSLTPSWGAVDELWVAFCEQASGNNGPVTFPANYVNGLNVNSGSFGTISICGAVRRRNVATEDPGVFDYASAANFAWGAITIAVRERATTDTVIVPTGGKLDSRTTGIAPTFRAIGTGTSGINTGISVPWPTNTTDDIGLLFVESANESMAAPSGWSEVAQDGLGTFQGTDGARLAVFWKRATAESSISLSILTDHTFAVIMTIKGCCRTGSPILQAKGQLRNASATATFPSVTTDIDNAFIVLASSNEIDSTAAKYSGWTNANLTGITEQFDVGTTSGNGGGIGVTTAILPTAGATGVSTATVTSSSGFDVTIALVPEPGIAPSVVQGRIITPTVGALTLTGFAPTVSLAGANTITPATGTLTIAGGTSVLDRAIITQVGTLTLAGIAPSAVQGTPITPNTGSLTLTGVAPSLIRGSVAAPTVGALTLTGASSVLDRAILTSAGTLTLAGVAPLLVQGAVVFPSAGSLTITGYSPTALAISDTSITPSAGSLTWTGQTSVLDRGIITQTGTLTLQGIASTLSRGTPLTPNTGALTLTGVASTLLLGTVVAPNAGTLTLTGASPTQGITITPSAGTLTLTGVAPFVNSGATIVTLTGSLTLTGLAATAIADTRITPTVGSLTLTGIAPVVVQGRLITPTVGSLVFAGVAPTTLKSEQIVPATGTLSLTGQSAVTRQDNIVAPQTGTITISGVAPKALLGQPITPLVGALATTGFAPSTLRGTVISPSTGALGLTTYKPTVVAPNSVTSDGGGDNKRARRKVKARVRIRSSWPVLSGVVVRIVVTGTGFEFKPATYKELASSLHASGKISLYSAAPESLVAIQYETVRQTAFATLRGSVQLHQSNVNIVHRMSDPALEDFITLMCTLPTERDVSLQSEDDG